MSLEQNSPRTTDQRPETWNNDDTLNATTRVPAPEHRDDKDKKGMSLKTKIGLTLAGLGVAGAGGFVASNAMSGEAPTKERSPAASATPNPGQSEAPSESPTETTPEVIDTAVTPTELTVDRYDDGESLVNAFYAQMNTWMNAGGSPETKANEPLTANHEEYLAEVAAEYDQAYIDALYVSDWESRPELRVEVAEKVQVHFATLRANIGTTESSEPADIEPYMNTITVTSVNEISNTGDEIVVEYETMREDNSDMNRASEFLTSTYAEPMPGVNRLTWVQENGVWKIAGDVPVN